MKEPTQEKANCRTVAYLRVSTLAQDLEKDKASILDFANSHQFGYVEWVQEKISGRVCWKERKIKEVIDTLSKGDRLIVPEMSRLGRSMLEIMEILSIAKQKEISIYDVKNGWTLDNSIQSKVLAMAFSIASEIERDLISKRTIEGLRAARERGKLLGRPRGAGKSKLDVHKEEITALLRNGSSKVFVAKRYHTTTANLYNFLSQNNLDVQPTA